MKGNVADTTKNQTFRDDVVLYVEDDEGFSDLFRHLLEKTGLKRTLIRVTNGEEAVAYFKGEGKYGDRHKFPLPCVAFIDLKMPRLNGFELLHWIREHSALSALPIVVLTVSEDVRDIKYAYQLGANSFLIKPPNIAELHEILTNVDKEWFRHNINVSSSPLEE